MSYNRLKVIHYPNRRNRFSKSVDWEIGQKKVMTPNFTIRLKNATELDLFLHLKSSYSLNFSSTYIVRLFDSPRTLYPYIKTLGQKQEKLFGGVIEELFSPSLARDVVFIDPALEYLYYDVENILRRVTSLFFLPKILRDYAKRCLKGKKIRKKSDYRKWREAYHRKFWNNIYEDGSKRIRMIRDIHNLEIKNKADILIPPVPLVTSSQLLDVAILMNKRSRELARGKKESADYFLLRSDALKKDEIIDKIKRYIADAEDTRLTIFKFKYLNLNNEERTLERNAYKNLLLDLSYISQHIENKAFMLLEGANQIFPSALTGFDIVSSSFSSDKEDRHSRKERSPFAKWYDPEYMVYRSRKELMQIIQNNHGAIPCHCPVCASSPSFLTEDFTEYNRNIKMHYIFCREAEMKEIYDAIERKTTAMGVDKIQRSSLKNLIDLIPR